MTKILLAEDNAGQRKAICHFLSAAGFEVTAAPNGYQAWTYAQADQFDLVITDYSMPEMTGSDLCRRLREDENYALTPIVLMSACADDLDVPRLASKLQLTDVWAKPFPMSSLVGRVKEILSADGVLL